MLINEQASMIFAFTLAARMLVREYCVCAAHVHQVKRTNVKLSFSIACLLVSAGNIRLERIPATSAGCSHLLLICNTKPAHSLSNVIR